jgi:hypothetical protein
MAQQLPCDLCGEEAAVVMFNNLADGSAMTVGAACLPQFFGGALLGAIGSDGHAGPPTKCQACRRTHERMTTPVAPLAAEAPAEAPEIPGQMAIEEAAETS